MRASATATMSNFSGLTEQTTEAEGRIAEKAQHLLSRRSAHFSAASAVILHVQLFWLEREARSKLTSLCEQISSCDEIPHEHRDKAIELAAALGGVSRELFGAVDRANARVDRLSREPARWGNRLSLHVYAFWAMRIEELACLAEDAAETLALGASNSFATQVREELHANA